MKKCKDCFWVDAWVSPEKDRAYQCKNPSVFSGDGKTGGWLIGTCGDEDCEVEFHVGSDFGCNLWLKKSKDKVRLRR